jgi:hypothetical protein
MMKIAGSPQTRLASFWSDTSGNATMEFVVLFPFLIYMLFSIAEAGVLMTRTVMLDRGLDLAVRDLRLGLTSGVTHDIIKQQICAGAFLLSGCEEAVLLELSPLPDLTSFPAGAANCVDRTETVEPIITFTPGGRSEIMFVRTCLIVDPVFPGTGLGAMLPVDASGGYAIVVQSAFMNEPE